MPWIIATTSRSSTTTSSICSRPGSIAASWCCGRSTGRRRRACWRRSSATRQCMRSATGTTCARASIRATGAATPSSIRRWSTSRLIFVEVALTRGIPAAIEPILSAKREPVETRAGDDGGVLFDLQLPARTRRRVVRPFPHQAGGRGDLPRDAAALDLRHAVAGAEFRRMAQARARHRGIGRAQRGGSRSARGARPCRLVAGRGNRRGGARAAAARRSLVLSARAHAARHCRSIRSHASISAMARGSSGSTSSPTRRSGRCANRTA